MKNIVKILVIITLLLTGCSRSKLYTAGEILDMHNEIVQEKGAGSKYYDELIDTLSELLNDLKDGVDITEIKETFLDIFGIIPENRDEAIKLINDFKEKICLSDNEYKGCTFSQFLGINNFFRESSNVKLENSKGKKIYKITNVTEFLQKNKISNKSIAKFLCFYKDNGAKITQSEDNLIIEAEQGTYAYYFFYGNINSKKDSGFQKWIKDEMEEIGSKYSKKDEDYYYYDVNMKNEKRYKLNYMFLVVAILDKKDKKCIYENIIEFGKINGEDLEFEIKAPKIIEEHPSHIGYTYCWSLVEK